MAATSVSFLVLEEYAPSFWMSVNAIGHEKTFFKSS